MKPGLLLIGGATDRMMARFNAEFTVHPLKDIDDLAGFLAEHGPEITAVATNGHDGVKPQIMEGLPNLKVISCYGVGYDAVDTATCAERGIIVSHTPGVLNDDVANTALLLILAAARNLVFNDQYVRQGRWVKDGNTPLTRSPEGKVFGILGLGRIGERIAEKLAQFNGKVVYHSRNKKNNVAYEYYDDLTKMARDCDYLIVITPGGAATNKLVNREVIEALGPSGTLINVARGTVVDETEMVAALQDGRLGWAGLDVFEDEPKVPEALFSLDNVTLLPHVASATVETRQAMGDLVCDNLSAFLKDGSVLTSVPETAHL
ncbi:2-hydroxyacid dehydrogenase [Oceaniglobus ichthyenteri]|uniref:2-hydroxyacid dehydrogenase n=1 Tax=Oceaniglobus ichthyenteri TaxID=2136177 RepID=UPI00197D1B26|nr:2-hydroxyacid dehydrogenase [Oceaniglobus ichthyenteri]